MSGIARRLPVGAETVEGGVSFRVWAPGRRHVEVVLEEAEEDQQTPPSGPSAATPDVAAVRRERSSGAGFPLEAEADGYFSAVVPAAAGARYRFRLDGAADLLPDPASRHQPDGPHGASVVVDADTFRWTDADWRGIGIAGQIIYEMHVGTFTPEGTWAAAAGKLPLLKEIGITVIEMMPVNEFPGRFGWGYDGVNLFAPTRLYGTPDDLRAFIDAAHREGIAVILDVVYNHFGPDGNYLGHYTQNYFTDRYDNEWGAAINFDGPGSEGTRDFFLANVTMWIEEYHFDGLRLDATQSLHDRSPEHIVAAIARTARKAAGSRAVIVIGENEPQDARLVRPPEAGGYGLDALWNDDLHHSAMVTLTGRAEAYYQDYDGSPQEFISAAKHGFLFQGQVYSQQAKRRGTHALDIPPPAFVTFVQNHDQVANSAWGHRFHRIASPARARAVTALLLLLPGTPMLFQGQEFWASAPFLYFADHEPELAAMVEKGRGEFMRQFPSLAALDHIPFRSNRSERQGYVQAFESGAISCRSDDFIRSESAPEGSPLTARPHEPSSFEASKLDWSEFDRNAAVVALHRDLIALRRTDPVFSTQKAGGLDGAVLGPEAFVLRFFGPDGDDRLVIVNLGTDIRRPSFPVPLMAPPAGRRWSLIGSSEDLGYGGGGTPPVETETGWHLPGHATVVLAGR